MLTTLRPRSLAIGAVAVLVLTGGLSACTETGESADGGSGSTTTTTLPDAIPTVAWVWTNPVTDTGGDVRVPVYATFQGGTEADVLTGVKVDGDLAEGAELVGEDRIELPPTTTVNLAEGTAHIELVGLRKELLYNRAFEITFEFEKADDTTVQGAVRNPADPNGTN